MKSVKIVKLFKTQVNHDNQFLNRRETCRTLHELNVLFYTCHCLTQNRFFDRNLSGKHVVIVARSADFFSTTILGEIELDLPARARPHH